MLGTQPRNPLARVEIVRCNTHPQTVLFDFALGFKCTHLLTATPFPQLKHETSIQKSGGNVGTPRLLTGAPHSATTAAGRI